MAYKRPIESRRIKNGVTRLRFELQAKKDKETFEAPSFGEVVGVGGGGVDRGSRQPALILSVVGRR